MFFLRRITRKLKRNRMIYALLIILTISIGISSRIFGEYLPSFVNLYIGDILWAVMIFLLVGFIFRRYSIFSVGILALVFAYGIEMTQLLTIPWLQEIRVTTLGALLLGKGFLWSDIVCYTIGVLIGVIGEYANYKLDFMFINKIK